MNLKNKYFLFSFLSTILFHSFVYSQVNIAYFKSFGASGTTGSKPPAYLTDGNYNTSSSPSNSNENLGFYYELDLEKDFNIDQIIIYCNVLFDYRIDIYKDNFGIRGSLVWSADITSHADNRKDIIKSNLDTDGVFNGRFIRLTNLSAIIGTPSIFEFEVYEAPLPVISLFESDAGNITKSGNANLPVSAKLSWKAQGYDNLSIDQGIGNLSTESGNISVSPNSMTKYTISASNQYGTVTKSITIGVDKLVMHPKISEFMAQNNAVIVDEDNDKSDWIEIFNPNEFSINIKDYYLTDKFDTPKKWKFPSCIVPPKGYIIVFCSSKNRTSPEYPLHTNFKLESSGEYLALVATNGTTILQQFPSDYPKIHIYPKQLGNVSYGVDSSGAVGYFKIPTPGAVNSTIENGIIEEVKFTPNRGVYNAPVILKLSCVTPGVTIRYTTDGSEPTEINGTVYSAPINLSTTKVIRAKAFRSGYVPTAIETHTYIFIDDVVNSSVMDVKITGNTSYKDQIVKGLAELPSISLVTKDTPNNTTEVGASVEWIDPITNQNLQLDAGTMFYGGSFTNFEKENFRLYFRSVYGDSKLTHPLFKGFEHSIPTVDKFDQLDLRAGGHDMAMRGFYMSNRFVDDLMLESGHLNPHGRFVHLYLDGVYWGQYHLRERWNDGMFAEYFNREKDDFEAISGNLNIGGWSNFEIPYAGDGSTWEHILSIRDNYLAVKEYVDLPQLINFMILYMYGNCENEYKAVGTKVPGVGFKFYLNDTDGFTRAGSNRTAMTQPGRNHADGPGSIFSMLLKEAHPDYMTLLADQIHDLCYNDGVLTPSRITSILNQRCTEVQNSIVAECARWGYRTPSNWIEAKNAYISTILPRRAQTILGYFKAVGFYPSIDAPVYNTEGGMVNLGFQLKMTSNAPYVYYTTDGSDPRLEGGSVSSKAISYLASGTSLSFNLINAKTNVSALVPTDATLGNTWTATDYAETASWVKSTSGAGVGFDNETTYLSHIDLDVKSRMSGISTSIFLRYTFELSDLSDVESLVLKMKCDDGYVIYLNGVKIASFNAPASLAWNSTATASYSDASAVNLNPVTITHTNAVSLLKVGKNVLAIQGLNFALSSTDFLIEPELSVTKKINVTSLDKILIDSSMTIKARAFDGTTWSALNNASFIVDSNINVVNDAIAKNTEKMVLSNNYPNPFSDKTTISYMVNVGGEAKLEIFDILGKNVWKQTYKVVPDNWYVETIETSNWQSGMFIYRLSNNTGIVKSGKMLHTK